MGPSDEVRFGAFRIALREQRLYRGDRPIELRPKVWQLLVLLSARPDELVGLDEIWATLWPDTVVDAHAITRLVAELRRALGDDGPRHVENVPRRGYRFRGAAPAPPGAASPGAAADVPPPVALVGRRAELGALRARWRRALAGERQLVLLHGEAGSGKTALIDELVRTVLPEARALDGAGRVLVARATCVPLHGEPPPYGPVIEALLGLAHVPHVATELRRTAPAWLLQLPGVASPPELRALAAAVAGSGPRRMLNEAAALLAAITRTTPLALVIDDAHWADSATIDLITTLLPRDEAARLLIVVAHRPLDTAVGRHPLAVVVEHARRTPRAESIAVVPLATAAVELLVVQRFGSTVPQLAELLVRRTGGNPLFVRVMLDHLVAQGWLDGGSGAWLRPLPEQTITLGVPPTLREMIELDVAEAAGGDARLLEAAALIGDGFDAAAVAAAAGDTVEHVDDVCHALARRGRVLQVAEGGPSTYAFVHELYRQVLAERVAPARARGLHQRIGEQLERAACDAGELHEAARIAEHFRRAGDLARTADWLERSALAALQRLAHREARDALEAAIAVIAELTPSPGRARREADRLIDLGNLRVVDLSASAARPSYDRALLLAEQAGDELLAFRARLGRCLASVMARTDDVVALADELLAAAGARPELATAAHQYALYARSVSGDLRGALLHGETALRMRPHALPDVPRAAPPRAHASLSRVLLLLGRDDEAEAQHRLALDEADRIGTPLARAEALVAGCFSRMLADEPDRVAQLARETLATIPSHETPGIADVAAACLAWSDARAERSDVTAFADAIDRPGSMQEGWLQEFLRLYLADELRRRGRLADARRALAACWRFAGYSEPERWRVLGLLKQDERRRAGARTARVTDAWPWDETLSADACLQRAVRVARDEQGSELFARRAEAALRAGEPSARRSR